MKRYSLNGEWKLKILGENKCRIPQEWIEAQVPGTVMGAYFEKGMIPDPYYRENELKVLPLFDNDFVYEKEFIMEKQQLSHDRLLLEFEGIDTLSDIYWNGNLLGSTENMHRSYEYDVTELAKEGENTLRVVLHSPVKYIKAENEKVYTGGAAESMEGFPHLRKAHCMFGWDWGPRLPDAGIFRNVMLLGIEEARIQDVYVVQEHSQENVLLRIHTNTQKLTAADVTLWLKVTVTAPDGRVYKEKEEALVGSVPSLQSEKGICGSGMCRQFAEQTIRIDNPELWWPNGYGKQPLYTVQVQLLNEKNQILDTWERRIGLRTLTMDTEPDEWGSKFAHCVNGLDIFAMGADYIPEDNFLGRCSRERTRKLLEDCVAAHYNCIRVWGGGYYPDDSFYDICDELGLIVWQDFMFACASYELDEAFERNITEEIRQNVRRLRHHASLGLWCGNNEMETQTLDGCWKPSAKQKADYTKIFEYIIPKIVKEEDPQTFYWPSSPSSGGSFDNPWDEGRGDAHYWDVWHGNKPFTAYRDYYFRYLSEFGFQSFPCLKTVESFTEPEDRNIFSRVMEMHQRNTAANGKIMNYLSQMYLYPKDFDSLLYASQLLQAEAIRYGVEHFRRYRSRCMGTVVWQLNDIWPVASWASIDYYGRWKALHYAECKMFAPVLISCEETGELTERPFCIQERKQPLKMAAHLHVANETRERQEGWVCWELRRQDATVIQEGKEKVSVPPFDGVWLTEQVFTGQDVQSCYVSYRFVQEDRTVSEGTALFTPPKHFRFQNPHLSVSVADGWITVTADAYAKNVELIPVNGEARLSDNYFDMNGGETRIRIVSGDATQFRARSVYDLGKV